MKKLISVLIIAGFMISCAQKEEKREEFKAEKNKDFKRNAGVDSAAFNDQGQVKDSLQAK